MPGPALASHSRVLSQTSHQLSTTTTLTPSPYAQPRYLPRRPVRPPSVADDSDSDGSGSDDFDARLSLFSKAAAISPLSPRWSLVPVDHGDEGISDDDDDDDDDDGEDSEDGKDKDDSAEAPDNGYARERAHDQSAPRTSTQIPLTLLFNSQSPRNTVGAAAAAAAATAATSQRLSMMSTTSTLSTPSTTSTTTALRRFWSPSSAPSAPSSPPLSSSATMTPGPATSATAPSTAPSSATAASTPLSTLAGTPIPCALGNGRSSNNTAATTPRNRGQVVMYIPPLVDATGGTLPRWSRRLLATSVPAPAAGPTEAPAPADDRIAAASPNRLLSADLICLVHSVPELCGLVWTRAMWPLLRLILAPGDRLGGGVAPAPVPLHLLALSYDEVVDAGETALQLGLALFALCFLIAMPVLFLGLPGAIFLACLTAGLTVARIASWPLNDSNGNTAKVPIAPWSIDSDETETPAKGANERWFFVSGMGATTRSLAKTGPRIAAVFGRPLTIVRPGHTYGMAADLAYAVLQRLLLPLCELPAPGVDVLYAGVRSALMHQRRVVVLAHNTGAIAVSQALARLQADVPAARLAQLEVYTFGSLAPDFVLSTAKTHLDANTAPHIEHVAHVRDPCARFGVLRSVREDLAGRYCGGVFVLGGEKRVSAGNLTTLRPMRSVSRIGDRSPMFRDIDTTPVRALQRRRSVVFNNRGSDGSGSGLRNHRNSFPLSSNQQEESPRRPNIQQPKPTKRWSIGFTSPLAAASRPSSSGSSGSNMSSTGSAEQRQAAPSVWSLSSALAVGRQYTSQRSTVSMEDYLTALFGPEPWSMRPDLDGSCLSLDAHFASATIAVDRELAEKREMAAMAQHTARNGSQDSEGPANGASPGDGLAKSKVAAAHLSWTGLGATATYSARKADEMGISGAEKRLAHDDGLLGLEATRRRCGKYDGQTGRDVSRLVGYFSDAVVWHRERFGV